MKNGANTSKRRSQRKKFYLLNGALQNMKAIMRSTDNNLVFFDIFTGNLLGY